MDPGRCRGSIASGLQLEAQGPGVLHRLAISVKRTIDPIRGGLPVAYNGAASSSGHGVAGPA